MFNLILIRQAADGRSTRRSLHAPIHFFALGLLAIASLATVGGLGYWAGRTLTHPGDSVAWQMRLAEQQTALANTKRDSTAEVDAMTRRLARLQSRVTRLDALGQRLIDASGIEAGEFDFDHDPGLGGVEDPYAQRIGAVGLDRGLNALTRRLADRERQYSVLGDVLAERRIDADSTPEGEPIDPDKSWISSTYGYREDPFTGQRAWHGGIDFAGRKGDAVHAVAAGVVTYAARRRGYGRLVEITHGDGYVTRYGHNSKILVQEGDLVRRGDQIAEMGSTGRSTGPHVHLEVLRDGESLNPWKYVQASR